ncbi:hypothetical protein D3C71_1511310 [compost metagenome]
MRFVQLPFKQTLGFKAHRTETPLQINASECFVTCQNDFQIASLGVARLVNFASPEFKHNGGKLGKATFVGWVRDDLDCFAFFLD